MPAPKRTPSPLKYPVYIYAHEVARLVGWKPQRVCRLWHKHGIAMKIDATVDKRGRQSCYVVTTPEKLQQLWPEQWEAILDRLEEGLK
jgi:hypothetical protein